VEVSILGGTWTVLTELLLGLHVGQDTDCRDRASPCGGYHHGQHTGYPDSFFVVFQVPPETCRDPKSISPRRNHLPIVLPSTLFSLRY
jgi:hypothetical protein